MDKLGKICVSDVKKGRMVMVIHIMGIRTSYVIDSCANVKKQEKMEKHV